MKKVITSLSILALVLLLITGCGSKANEPEGGSAAATGDAKPVILKLGHVLPTTEIHSQAAVMFANEVDKNTNGSVRVEIYSNGALGKDKDLLEGLKVGTADIWLGGAGVLSGSSDTAKIFTVPFMFDSQEHFDKVYDGEVGQMISDKIAQESGYKVLSYWTRGARWLTVNKEVKTPDDMKGLKIRVPESPVFVKSFETMGAAPTPMAFGEVFTGLQQKVIDGQENPLSLIYSSKFNEVVKYLVKTEHVREPISLVISDAKFKSLTPEQQKGILDAANGTAKQYTIDEVTKGDAQYLQQLQHGGMTLVEPDIAAFQAKLNGFVDKQFPEIKEVYDAIRAAK